MSMEHPSFYETVIQNFYSMEDFHMSKPTLSEEEVYEDLCRIPYIQSEDDKAVEDILKTYYQPRIHASSEEALSLVLQDLYVPGIVERIEGKTIQAGITIKSAVQRLSQFVGNIRVRLMTSILTEENIRKRFAKLRVVWLPFSQDGSEDNKEYCVAPTYEVMTARLRVLSDITPYLRRLAESENPSDVVDGNTYGKVSSMSNGVLKVEASQTGLVSHLVWQAPPLQKVYCRQSPLAKMANIDNLCNAALFVRNTTTENLVNLVDTAFKKTQRALEPFEGMPISEDNENVERAMRDYSVSYMLTKMARDVVKQGIQREVNTLAVNYLAKLKHIKSDK